VNDLPAVFYAADDASSAAQQRYVQLVRTQTGLLLLAALLSVAAAGWERPLIGVAAIVVLAVVALLEIVPAKAVADGAWYLGRAVAESAKTLGWRYAVGGAPFFVVSTEESAERLLAERLDDVVSLGGRGWLLRAEDEAIATSWMISCRGSSLEQRRTVYRKRRIEDQIRWYESKATENARSSKVWTIVPASISVAGIALALFVRSDGPWIAAIALASVGTCAAMAWAMLRSYRQQAEAYRLTAEELQSIRQAVDSVVEEEAWAIFVAGAEHAISREHTMWSATRP